MTIQIILASKKRKSIWSHNSSGLGWSNHKRHEDPIESSQKIINIWPTVSYKGKVLNLKQSYFQFRKIVVSEMEWAHLWLVFITNPLFPSLDCNQITINLHPRASILKKKNPWTLKLHTRKASSRLQYLIRYYGHVLNVKIDNILNYH